MCALRLCSDVIVLADPAGPGGLKGFQLGLASAVGKLILRSQNAGNRKIPPDAVAEIRSGELVNAARGRAHSADSKHGASK